MNQWLVDREGGGVHRSGAELLLDRGSALLSRSRRGTTLFRGALAGSVTAARARGAVAGLGQLAVGADAGLRVHAPKDAVVGGRHGGIVFGLDELAFPAQRRTQVVAVRIESFGIQV